MHTYDLIRQLQHFRLVDLSGDAKNRLRVSLACNNFLSLRTKKSIMRRDASLPIQLKLKKKTPIQLDSRKEKTSIYMVRIIHIICELQFQEWEKKKCFLRGIQTTTKIQIKILLIHSMINWKSIRFDVIRPM